MNYLITEYAPSHIGNNLVFEDTAGCVNSLKHIGPGEVWPREDIQIRKESMLRRGRDWQVVDNLIVHENIKLGDKSMRDYIRNYQETLVNLSDSGIRVVCFNFMPVFYKVRTHFNAKCPGSHVFSLFDAIAFTAFDLYILERRDAEKNYSAYQRHQAKCYFSKLSPEDQDTLSANILKSAQFQRIVGLRNLKEQLEKYNFCSSRELNRNLEVFKQNILPLAESLGLKMHLCSDNPAPGLLGLPSVFECP